MVAHSLSPEKDDTREKLLAAAHRQFADRGFYGASIAQIAGEVGLTKQALLYHFKRKEDLYSEVLRRISQRMMETTRAHVSENDSPAQQFEGMMLGIYHAATDDVLDTRILLRELLDNQRSEAPEEEWYFKPFLEGVVARLDRVDGMAGLEFSEKYARIYFLISAIEFFAVSRGMITRFYGEEEAAAITDAYPEQLRTQVHRVLGLNGAQ
ncbi:MAG: TetR/AcrR family transcriptional regulator [Erythrobacter sp.]